MTMELNKGTKMTLSISTLLAILSGAYVFSGDVHEVKNQVASNTATIQSIETRGIAREISDKKSERRKLRKELKKDPDNPDTLEDLEEVQDELEALQLIQKCIEEPERKRCK